MPGGPAYHSCQWICRKCWRRLEWIVGYPDIGQKRPSGRLPHTSPNRTSGQPSGKQAPDSGGRFLNATPSRRIYPRLIIRVPRSLDPEKANFLLVRKSPTTEIGASDGCPGVRIVLIWALYLS